MSGSHIFTATPSHTHTPLRIWHLVASKTNEPETRRRKQTVNTYAAYPAEIGTNSSRFDSLPKGDFTPKAHVWILDRGVDRGRSADYRGDAWREEKSKSPIYMWNLSAYSQREVKEEVDLKAACDVTNRGRETKSRRWRASILMWGYGGIVRPEVLTGWTVEPENDGDPALHAVVLLLHYYCVRGSYNECTRISDR